VPELKDSVLRFTPLQQIKLSVWAGFFSVVLLGCQTPNGKDMGVVPMYATSFEAQAVAVGQFGAVPIELVGESDLAVVELMCSRRVAKVRSPSGKFGWVPVTSIQKFHC
jgi:hypothetical protein